MAKFNKSKVDKTKNVPAPFPIVDPDFQEAPEQYDFDDYEYDDYYDEWLDDDDYPETVDPEAAAKEKALQELEDLARKIRATEGE